MIPRVIESEEETESNGGVDGSVVGKDKSQQRQTSAEQRKALLKLERKELEQPQHVSSQGNHRRRRGESKLSKVDLGQKAPHDATNGLNQGEKLRPELFALIAEFAQAGEAHGTVSSFARCSRAIRQNLSLTWGRYRKVWNLTPIYAFVWTWERHFRPPYSQ